MTPDKQHFVRSTSIDLADVDLLRQPVTELFGVGSGAAGALDAINITTIFDLGSSAVFAKASAAVAGADGGLPMLAADVLGATGADAIPADVPDLPVHRLHGVSQAVGTALAAELDAPTIRDFASWPPRRFAHALVSAAAGTELPSDEDAESGAQGLRPRMGEFPTERVFYSKLVMLGSESPGNLAPLSGPLSLASLASDSFVFGAPAVGAIATYSQSWFSRGITLGQMLHSLALAPGEATRIAVVDWSRRTSATASEDISQTEQLDQSTSHARSISEVQNAVANEHQSGGSIATGWSKSTSEGKGYAGSFGAGAAGVVGKVAGAIGLSFGGSKSKQESETHSSATSVSWSHGSRDVMASMEQSVNDSTEQHASSVRNRRATAVREVSQSEHEEVSTRIVANYNHMHALTIQYYEVVQLYRVAVRLAKFDRALFLPFSLLDFTGADAMDQVAQFRGQLLGAALTARAADLLADDQGRVEVHSAVRVPLPVTVATFEPLVASAGFAVAAAPGAAAGSGGSPAAGTASPAATSATPAASGRSTRFSVVRPGPIAEVIPGDATLVSVAFDDVGIDRVRIDQPGVSADASTFVVPSGTAQVDFPNAIPLRAIDAMHVARDGGQVSEGTLVLRYETGGHESIAEVPLALVTGAGMQKVAYFRGDAANRRQELLDHLQDNRAYYTRAVLEGLDAASVVALLSGVSWNGRPLVDQVEPNPVAVAGNFLVLRAPAEDRDPSGLPQYATWKDLLDDREISFGRTDARLVPIPTGGVFAEAVLGRSNSAEKLDITRFWNWQDSPAPLTPPEIAPVGVGSRRDAEGLMPSQLGAPVVNLQTPTSLPDPSGLSASLGALAAGSMFRDMSGLAGTQATAQAASAGTLSAATEAGKIASENYKVAAAQATEMAKTAASVFAVNKGAGKGDGAGAGKAGSGGTAAGQKAGISGEGALINQGRDMDKRGVGAPPAGGSKGGSSAPAGTAPGSGSGSGTAPDIMPGNQYKLPNGFPGAPSRERDYADMLAGGSPGMMGEMFSSLGGEYQLASYIPGGIPAGVAVTVYQMMVLAQMEADAKAAGVNLTGVTLLPMHQHKNSADFTSIYRTNATPPLVDGPEPYGAWTNSPTSIYVNLDLLATIFQKVGKAEARAFGAYVLRHEAQHVAQFQANQGKPPASFKDMADFEKKSYGADVVWLGTQANYDYLTVTLGASQTFVDGLADSADENVKAMTRVLSSGSTTEADWRDAMKKEFAIPNAIRGVKDYAVASMYKA